MPFWCSLAFFWVFFDALGLSFGGLGPSFGAFVPQVEEITSRGQIEGEFGVQIGPHFGSTSFFFFFYRLWAVLFDLAFSGSFFIVFWPPRGSQKP